MFGLLIRNLRKTTHRRQADSLPAGSKFHVRRCAVVRMRAGPEPRGLPCRFRCSIIQTHCNAIQTLLQLNSNNYS